MRWLDGYRPRDARFVVFHPGRGSGGLGDRLVARQPSSHGRMLTER